MEKEKISIIITVFNVEKYLEKCLDSVINQTYHNLEIILVDDGSSDNSFEICNQYAKQDKRIRVIHKKNEGLVRARKTGINAATGGYIGYVDADDWIEPQMYQKLYETICDKGADVVAAGRIEEHSYGSVICKNKIEPGVYKEAGLKNLYSKMLYSGKFYEFGLYPTVWDKLFKRELLLRNQQQVPDCINIGEDVACVYPCLLEANIICVLDECYYHYRKHGESMLSTKDNEYSTRVCKLHQYLYDRGQKTEYWDLLKPQIDAYILDSMLNGAWSVYNIGIPRERNQYLFPFSSVKEDSNIVLYGAGKVGETYWKQIKHTAYCNVVTWVDKNADKIDNSMGKIEFPKMLRNMEYDQIIICIKSKAIAWEIKDELISMGIDSEKIVWENPVYC